MAKQGKTDVSNLPAMFNNLLRQEQNTIRILSHMVVASWKLYGSDQARIMMYTLGRIAGTQMCIRIKSEYSMNQEVNWNEFLESIEVLGKIFLKTTVKILSNSDEKILIRVMDSPCCSSLADFDQPCCDFIAGILASYASFIFTGAETTCNELTCKATGYSPYCDFELNIFWNKTI